MKSDYGKLKLKMFLQILATAVVTGVVGLLVKAVLIDGVLQRPFADGFVAFCQGFLAMDDEEAVNLYRKLFRYNKEEIMLAGFVALLLAFLGFTISRFVHYFNKISLGVDRLLDDSEQAIILKPELEAMQNKLNAVKTALRERKLAALESEQRKNDLVVYLAHDLKTPLTSVIGYLTLLRDAPDMPAGQRAKYTSVSLDKALHLEGLINEFFDITRFSLQNILLDEAEINLSVMLDQLADEFYPVLAPKGMRVVVRSGDNIRIRGDANKLARVFGNLLRNAYFYGYENSLIEIAAAKNGGSVSISFRNQGPVISAHQLKSIFEKFYRVDPARSSGAGGTGLGLAIARKIVELHHGDIVARSSPEFTEFEVTLPVSV